jgi:hypothetical protein
MDKDGSMDPLDDARLNEVLGTWHAPDAPPTLRDRVLAREGRAGDDTRGTAHAPVAAQDAAASVEATFGVGHALLWLLTGSIRIPVPLGLAAAIVAAVWIYVATADRQPSSTDEAAEADPVVSLADFEPVERVEPRIVGGSQ